MNILVTGGAGYIGSHVCLSLLDAGYNITVIDDLSSGQKKLIPDKVEFIQANINDTNKLNKLFQKKSFNTLMHFAGFVQVEESVKFPEKYFNNNTKNATILFETCINNGLKNIIFSSTAAVYGNPNKELIHEGATLNPLNPYGESKVQTENKLIKMQKNNNFNYIILRYFNVAGADPKLRSGLISKKPTHLIKIASQAAIGKLNSVTIFGNDYNTHDGTAIRDYIHVSDLADIHVKSLEYILEKKQSKILNCGYGKGYSVKEVLDTLNRVCNNKIYIKYGNRRSGDAVSLVSNTNQLMETISWAPKYNDLETILKTSIKWENKIQNEKIL
tara:strand:+ start:308 stop:1297 length:990 start_codon:yes stop_codon:yes gene_type:complete